MLPNGVSARAANAATPPGSAYTVCSTDGTSQGRLPTASAPSATAMVFLLLVYSATGTTTSAVMAMAAKPPTAAGSSARARRAAPRFVLPRSNRSMARNTQGSPA